MPATPGEMFTNVPVDLFRMGNASGPRLVNVRPQDVDIVDEKLPSGQVIRMVHPRGGISTFDGINRTGFPGSGGASPPVPHSPTRSGSYGTSAIRSPN